MPTILVVDDHPLNRKYLKTLLGAEGVALLEAADGLAAFEIARERKPDLVVTDLIMPSVDGFELARRIREDETIASTPIIFYTAVDGLGAARSLAAQCGVASVIAKPAAPEEILEAVVAALGSGRERLEPDPIPPHFDRDHSRLLGDELAQHVVELEGANRRLRILNDIDRAILRADSAETIATVVVNHLEQLAQSQRTSVTLIDAEREEIRELACRSSGEPADPLRASFASLGSARPLIAELRRGQAVALDAAAHAAESAMCAELGVDGARYFHLQPMTVRGRLIGWVAIAATRPLELPREVRESIREAADDMAIALDQARLHAELEQHAAELERRVEERTRDLRDVNAELEKFCHSIAHDLRNPLSGIIGFGEMLVDDEAPRMSDKGKRRLAQIVTSANQMDELIGALLGYAAATREELVLAPIDLERLLKKVLFELAAVLEQRHARVAVERPLPLVVGHGVGVGRVLSNLIANATKFVAAGVEPRVQVRGERRGDTARIWVEDNGIGIPPEHQEKIFGVLTRLNAAYEGSGIGLAIVKRAVERSGGRVGVESAPGCGSRFWIELPCAEENRAPEAASGGARS